MTHDEACAEQDRITSLLESNPDYTYCSLIGPIMDEDGNIIDYYLGIGWYAKIKDREVGNMLAITHVGAPVESVRKMIHHNYMSVTADL
jgi:hypothetical protein